MVLPALEALGLQQRPEQVDQNSQGHDSTDSVLQHRSILLSGRPLEPVAERGVPDRQSEESEHDRDEYQI
jgi:hypothetical protein